MDEIHFRSLSRKWAFKLREDAQDIEQEIIIFYLTRQSEDKNLDIFLPGHEGALFELLKHKIRGNNLESLGGSGKRLGGAGDDADACDAEIQDEFESPDEKADQLEKRLQFEQVFCQELDQIDELNNLAGSDLGDAFGFTGANGRAILSQLKKQIVASAQKRFNANLQAVKPTSRARARRQAATA
ncbi:MAG: hypothetical protein PHQ58_23360 [Rhodoferax sp.]|uniref:hypothetical protein n=1 Tax=Rhodoferax sp. TaxID=50421 RepID=UPI0026259564|nr:hypothetical protein [Rhodoferax sp.]MDD2883359.1 hypothetical protein [Rhodoferax sp.]